MGTGLNRLSESLENKYIKNKSISEDVEEGYPFSDYQEPEQPSFDWISFRSQLRRALVREFGFSFDNCANFANYNKRSISFKISHFFKGDRDLDEIFLCTKGIFDDPKTAKFVSALDVYNWIESYIKDYPVELKVRMGDFLGGHSIPWVSYVVSCKRGV